MSKNIFILGCGIMQMPAIRIAQEKGWKVFTADGNPEAPGISPDSIFYPIDLKDKEALLDKATEIRDQYGLDGVFTAGTDFSTSVAYVTEALGLPGISYQTALNASDKVLMRGCFEKYGVPSPRFFEADSSFRSSSLPQGILFPVVVKPVDSMGARGVERIDHQDHLIPAVMRAVSFSRSKRALVEEYIDGQEFSLDAVVHHGTVTITGFADRHIFYPPYFIEMGHTMPTCADISVQQHVAEVFFQGIKALGIDNGTAKGDIRYDGKQAFVGEIAARLSGGFMSGWTFPYSSGISAIKSAMNIAVGLPPESLTPRKNDVCCERAVLSIPGKIKSINTEKILSLPHIKECFVHCCSGDTVVFPRNNVEKCVNILSLHQNRKSAVKAAETACSLVDIHLDPENDDTAKFLQERPLWIPPAYVIQESCIQEYYKSLERMFILDFRNTHYPEVQGIPEIYIPDELYKENKKDWNHRELGESLVKLAGEGLFSAVHHQIADRVNYHFWASFFRGGYSGAHWFLERLALFCCEKSPDSGA